MIPLKHQIKIFVLTFLLSIINLMGIYGQASIPKKTVRLKKVIYDTVKVYQAVNRNQKIFNPAFQRIDPIKINSINQDDSLKKTLVSATFYNKNIILNANSKNIKNMKKVSFTSILVMLLSLGIQAQDSIKTDSIRNLDPFYVKHKNSYYSIAVGGGFSYAVCGLKFQARYGNKFGYGFQIGYGYSPVADGRKIDSRNLSAGIKLYPYKWFYINPQVILIPDKFIFHNDSWGALMFGGDWFLNNWFGINTGVGLYWGDIEASPMFDFGLAYKF